jgi:hypothetical protein
MTLGAAVTLQIQAGNKSIKKTRDEAMAPDLAMVTFQAGGRGNPRVIFALLKNVLELSSNKIYHKVALSYGEASPRCKRAVSS